MDKKYFEDYHQSKLQNQKRLCEVLKKTKYNIEPDDTNPMTIRLLVTYDNLHKIKELASQWRSIASKLIVCNNYSDKVSGAPNIEAIIFPGNTKKFPLICVHKALFGFFSNINSAMDRLAYEIGKLYEIKNKNIDWNYFFGKTPECSIPLLKDIVNSRDKTKINWVIGCRNRLLHDGILKFKLDRYKYSIYLPKNPRIDRVS